MKLYRNSPGALIEHEGRTYTLASIDWDHLLSNDDPRSLALGLIANISPSAGGLDVDQPFAAPIASQEVWAAGVTYFRSRSARMEESKSAGGGNFYDRVYTAERPELFFKGTAHRVVGHRDKVAIRSDASWSVPEPELALLISASGKITGYTIGNDMSSRDIEGENPLYLPQAKVYDRSCALGPGILLSPDPMPPSTAIQLEILRDGTPVFTGATALSSMKRDPKTLVEYLFRDNSFPNGCFLLTGTGVVPPDSFTLRPGDEVRIVIDGIGTLVNFVSQGRLSDAKLP
jgi:2-dehydro-3-deoxy-D-arabinonate dehydratase